MGSIYIATTNPFGKRKYIYSKDLQTLREKEKQLVKDQLDGLDVYAAGNADVNFVFDRYISTKTELRKTTYSNYMYTYNHYVRDGLPSLGMMTINALVSSDSVLIPVQAAYLPVKGLQQLIKTISMVKKRLNRRLTIEGILLTMVDFRTNYAKDIAALVQETYGSQIAIFKNVIPMSVKAAETSAEGISIYTHCPKGKVSMMLTAACTNRKLFPNMEDIEPFNVIYQTAEDGMGDTIKPRLVEAGADLSRVMVIDDTEEALTLSDDRIEKAVRQNHVRLVIIDPVQAFIGADVDMNRANEVRPVFRKLGMIAEKTGCAIVLIGHLNKSSGTQSTYRGLGSIDIMAAVRSLIFIGKVRKDPTTRVLIHEKSSLAPPGETMAFKLGDEEGFLWVGAYEISADE